MTRSEAAPATAPPKDGPGRGKYGPLIDRDLRAFIDRTNALYPPEAASRPIGENRAIYDAMCAAFRHPYPANVRAQDGAIDAAGRPLPLRRYRVDGQAAGAAILYCHGGGFILGGLDSHDDICADLCGGTGYDVISVDYRLAPEHPHPAAFEDACAAFDWLAGAGDLPIVLCGESAGGNLAAAVAHAKRAHRRAAIGQMLIYPGLGGDMGARSYIEHADAPLLTAKDVLFYRDVRTGGRPAGRDPTLSPVDDTDFSHLPPTVVFTAECDPLSSDGEAYRDRLIAAGGRAWWHEEPGLVHGFLRARHTARRAGAAFARIVATAGALGRGDWPY